METLLTLRLDEKTRKRIALIARRDKVSKSEVVRRAIEKWGDVDEPVSSPCEAISDLIGAVHGGNPKGSEQTGRRFTKLLKGRKGRSRSSSIPGL